MALPMVRSMAEGVGDSGEPRAAIQSAVGPIAVMALALAVRLIRLGSQGLWFDEAYTAWIAQLPGTRAWEALLADGVHPPLFYLVQTAFRGLAGSEFGLRLPSAVAGSAASPLLFVLADRWLGRRAAWLAGLLAAVCPFNVWYSQDARMYAMLATVNIACILAFDSLLARPSRAVQALFVVSHTFAYGLHYFALMLPLIELLLVILALRESARRLRLWTALQAVSAIPLLVWVVAVASREANIFGIGWIEPPRPFDLALTLVNLNLGYAEFPTPWHWLGALLCTILLLAGALARWPSSTRKWLALLWAFVPIVLTYGLSFRRPVYIDRFLIGSSMGILLLIAAGAVSLPRRLSTLAGIALIAVFLLGLARIWLSPCCVKEQWREAAQVLRQASAEEVVALRVLQIAVPLQYYDPGPTPLRPVEANRLVTPIDDIARGATGTWLVYWNPSSDAHALAGSKPFEAKDESDPDLASWLSGLGPELLERTDLVGVTLLHFGPLP